MGSGESWFEPRRGNSERGGTIVPSRFMFWGAMRPFREWVLLGEHLLQSLRPRAPKADNLTGNGVPTSIGALSVSPCAPSDTPLHSSVLPPAHALTYSSLRNASTVSPASRT